MWHSNLLVHLYLENFPLKQPKERKIHKTDFSFSLPLLSRALWSLRVSDHNPLSQSLKHQILSLPFFSGLKTIYIPKENVQSWMCWVYENDILVFLMCKMKAAQSPCPSHFCPPPSDYRPEPISGFSPILITSSALCPFVSVLITSISEILHAAFQTHDWDHLERHRQLISPRSSFYNILLAESTI